MNSKIVFSLSALMFALAAPAFCEDSFFSELDGIQAESRDQGTAMRAESVKSQAMLKAAPPKDDIKASVIRHLDRAIAYCDKNKKDCDGANGSIRDFSKGIGGGRCNNRGFNCVHEVLETCRDEISRKEITPMYYMACAAMLGKIGERDCAEGRATCAAQLQGSVYFALRGAAGCHKSFEGKKDKLATADALAKRFAVKAGQDIKAVYVEDAEAEQAQTIGHHLAWHTGKEGAVIGTEKVLEFAFEKLAMHGAQLAVESAGGPLFIFSTVMLFHEIAASEMNDQVCTQWDHSYKGSYANAASSLDKMTRNIK